MVQILQCMKDDTLVKTSLHSPVKIVGFSDVNIAKRLSPVTKSEGPSAKH